MRIFCFVRRDESLYKSSHGLSATSQLYLKRSLLVIIGSKLIASLIASLRGFEILDIVPYFETGSSTRISFSFCWCEILWIFSAVNSFVGPVISVTSESFISSKSSPLISLANRKRLRTLSS